MANHHLPDLAPDIRFELLLDTLDACEFSFRVKKEALGPHVRARWPWDDDYQRRVHRQRLDEKPFFKITKDGTMIGTLSWQVHPDHVRFGEFYLLEKYQGRGLGTRILRHALALADAGALPVRLEYLKWNPVGRLYLRNGFKPTQETDIHLFLERPVPASN